MNKTIAERLGRTPHLSPLLRKARRCGLNSPEALLNLAVKRGCSHYAPPDYDPARVLDARSENLSDDELAIALIAGAQEYHPQRIRCAAQLLGSPRIDPETVSRLAAMESCGTVLAHIARSALTYDQPEHHKVWKRMLSRLKPPIEASEGTLPHPSRFIIQRGITRPGAGKGKKSHWLRPASIPRR